MAIYTNPLYERLTRHLRWPSVRASFWIAFLTGLILLAAVVWGLPQPGASAVVDLTKWFALAGLMALVPLIIAPVTAVMIGVDAGSENYEMLRLTLIEPNSVIYGYFWAALIRLRVLLIPILGLVTALYCFDLLIARIGFIMTAANLSCVGQYCGPEVPVRVGEMRPVMWSSALLLMYLWGLAVFAAAFGVLNGLRFRRPGPAALAAGLLTPPIVGVLSWNVLFFGAGSIMILYLAPVAIALLAAAFAIALVVAAPVLITRDALRLCRQWVEVYGE